MKHSLLEAKRLGYVRSLLRASGYFRASLLRASVRYHRAGGASDDALMAMPLYDGALDGITGEFHEDPAFNINAAEAERLTVLFRTRNRLKCRLLLRCSKACTPARKAFGIKGHRLRR